jgi:dephospho-CoA kinase
MKRRVRIALTGGIACGKSTVANLFGALGVTIVDTDLLAREVVAPGSALLPQIAAHFGASILQADGNLDRAKLREIVFADAAERRWLEALTHPAIRTLTDTRCDSATGRYVIVAIPLLVETRGAGRFDRVLVVDCDPELQLARLQARDGATRQQAERVLAAQATREQRLAMADDVILNNGDLDGLRVQVERLHRTYSNLASVQSDRSAS